MTVTGNDQRKTRRTTYLVFTVIFVLLAGAALFSFRSAKADERAMEKAEQLSAEFAAAGLRVPSTDRIAHVLGDDGGAACARPNEALKRGALFGALTNGASGPGLRPIIADNQVLQAQVLVIKVYCPDELAEFSETVENLKLDDLVKR